MKNLLTLILLSCVLVPSCRKDKRIPFCTLNPDECYEVRDVKDYMYFKDGTYWVYEEENSGILDSVYVIESYSDSNSVYFNMKVHSDYENYNYRYWPKLAQGCPDSGLVEKLNCTLIKKSKINPGFVSEAYVFIYWAEIGDSAYNYYTIEQSSYVSLIDISNNLEIKGNLFEKTYIFEEPHTPSDNSQHTKNYYSKNYGLVKKELIDSNQIWNLIRYNIVQ